MSKKAYKFSRRAENLIANLRGVPENYSPIGREIREMGGIFDKILDRYKIGVESLEDRIRENWEQIVGAPNAQHCNPVRIERENTLIIAVSNPIIRQELQFNQSHLLKNLRSIEKGNRIRYVVFRSG
ncbi:MAG: DUF721 domain-containing protein [Opitutaceae bacterium]|jgi:hypothetical protein|nr:DUF721 domain-containing protein [Opitutaceae bacterium]|tara:strand:+ start:40 stop:420 length:381 start_codon:yes stop_codon:yes gene_type:complete